VVLRSYLLESLINEGKTELIAWGGTAPPLDRYVTHIRTLAGCGKIVVERAVSASLLLSRGFSG
jgi:hypothetical protein